MYDGRLCSAVRRRVIPEFCGHVDTLQINTAGFTCRCFIVLSYLLVGPTACGGRSKRRTGNGLGASVGAAPLHLATATPYFASASSSRRPRLTASDGKRGLHPRANSKRPSGAAPVAATTAAVIAAFSTTTAAALQRYLRSQPPPLSAGGMPHRQRRGNQAGGALSPPHLPPPISPPQPPSPRLPSTEMFDADFLTGGNEEDLVCAAEPQASACWRHPAAGHIACVAGVDTHAHNRLHLPRLDSDAAVEAPQCCG